MLSKKTQRKCAKSLIIVGLTFLICGWIWMLFYPILQQPEDWRILAFIILIFVLEIGANMVVAIWWRD